MVLGDFCGHTYSPQLMWECVKQYGTAMSRKPITPNLPKMSACQNNLAGIASYKFSGLLGGMTFSIAPEKKGDKESIVMITAGKKSMRPKNRLVKTTLSKNTKKGLAQIEAEIIGPHHSLSPSLPLYRKDLLDLAKVKYAKIKTSFKKKARKVNSRRAKKA